MRPYTPHKLFSEGKYAILLLNREIKLNSEFFTKIWNQGQIRHTVDGGSNHFHSFYKSQTDEKSVANLKLPELTSGDFDSINPDVMEFLQTKGQTKIIRTDDQDETDFTKALTVLSEFIHSNQRTIEIETVVALVEPSGRLDQILSNFQTLYKNPMGDNVHVYLMSSETLTWLLPGGTNSTIEFRHQLQLACGIVPLSGPTKIKSLGLKWELNGAVYNFGGVISTSNVIVNSSVEIEPKVNPVLFTVEMKPEYYEE